MAGVLAIVDRSEENIVISSFQNMRVAEIGLQAGQYVLMGRVTVTNLNNDPQLVRAHIRRGSGAGTVLALDDR